RDWGAERKYVHQLPGFNYRLEHLQGAILRVKLRHLDCWTAARRAHAARYTADLAGSCARPVAAMASARHVYHIFAVRASNRDSLQRGLLARGLRTGLHYPIPVHLQPAYAHLAHAPGDFPPAERAAGEVLSLPMYAEVGASDIERVVAAIHTVGGERCRS